MAKLKAHHWCPVRGVSTSFFEVREAELYLQLAQKYWVPFMRIAELVTETIWGPEMMDRDFKVSEALAEIKAEAECDAASLAAGKLSLERLIDIWCRASVQLIRLKHFFPSQREQIEAMLAEREGVMEAMIELHESRHGCQ